MPRLVFFTARRQQLLMLLALILGASPSHSTHGGQRNPGTVLSGEGADGSSEYTRLLARHILQESTPTPDAYGYDDAAYDPVYDYPTDISDSAVPGPPPPPPPPPPEAVFDPPRSPEATVALPPAPEVLPTPGSAPPTPPSRPAPDGELPPLAMASQSGNVEEVRKLLNGGGQDVDAQFAALRNRTALHLAAQHNHVEVVELLIKNGATVDSRDADQNTPLHLALQGQAYLEVVEALLAAGADPSLVNSVGRTSLHMAMSFIPSLGVLEALIDAGASLDAQDIEGETPLHIGARNGELLAVKHLIDSGADASIRDRRGFPVRQAVCRTTCHGGMTERLLRSLEKAMVA